MPRPPRPARRLAGKRRGVSDPGPGSSDADRIHALLPQTQCTRCGYPDCRAYAEAIASGEARINQCPPGGQEGISRLARLTGQPEQPLDPAFGREGPMTVAVIDENWCIGCTLCIKACPTDAILGTNKRMHTVIEAYCTGCDLCLPVCPVDCITMEPISGSRTGWQAWGPEQAVTARVRYERRRERLASEASVRIARHEAQAQAKLADLAAHSRLTDPATLDRKKTLIAAALTRARAAREANEPTR